MKITKVMVVRGRKLHLENYDTENFEIQIESAIEDNDDPQEVIQGLKNILERHLDSWEQQKREHLSSMEKTQQVSIKTAEELVSEDANIRENIPAQTEVREETKNDEQDQTPLICPKCNEIMVKKEGKDYYLCSKHWGYPDMIKKGQVREKRY